MTSTNNEKVLIFLFGSLGDTIVAIPALRAVRRHFPKAELVLLQNAPSSGIVKPSEVIPSDLIDRYFSYNSNAGILGKLKEFFQSRRRLRQEHFQTVIYLVISERPPRSVLRDKVFFRSCGVRSLIGFHAFSKAYLFPVDEFRLPAMTENEAVRRLKRLEIDGIETFPEDLHQPLLTYSPTELEAMDKWLAARRTKSGSLLAAISPIGKIHTNAWPIENFIELGHRLIAEFNCELVVTGGLNAREAGEKMIAAWGEGINAAGEFSVRESGALLSRCDHYVGIDTGTAHLAAASGARCFVIMDGRRNPGQWFPLGEGHSIIRHPVKCAGYKLMVCPLPDHPCMNGISVESAWQNLTRFIQMCTRTATPHRTHHKAVGK